MADSVSGVSPLPPECTNIQPDQLIPLYLLTASIPANETCLEKVRGSSALDATLQQLAQYVHHGWPKQKAHCDPRVQQYWTDYANISLEDGILFRGIQMIILTAMWPEFIKKLHEAHMGEEKSLLLVRMTIYWPNYTEAVCQSIRECSTCQSIRPSLKKEEVLPYGIPAGPWKKTRIWLLWVESAQVPFSWRLLFTISHSAISQLWNNCSPCIHPEDHLLWVWFFQQKLSQIKGIQLIPTVKWLHWGHSENSQANAGKMQKNNVMQCNV